MPLQASPRHELRQVPVVAPGPSGDHVATGQVEHAAEQRHGLGVDPGGDARRGHHRVEVAQEAEPGDVGRRIDAHLHHGLGGDVVQLRHQLHRLLDLLT